MPKVSRIHQENYDPNGLIDEMIVRANVSNDAALARTLGVPREVISKIRHKRIPVGAAMLIVMHEISGLSFADLRALMGDSRQTERY